MPKSLAATSIIAGVGAHWVKTLNVSTLLLWGPEPCAYLGHLVNYWCAPLLLPLLLQPQVCSSPALQLGVCQPASYAQRLNISMFAAARA